MEIKWNDTDPETGQRRYLCAERFAGVWRFRWKLQRRGEWTRGLEPTRAMWEHVFDCMQRRYRRREGVDDKDLAQVEKILRALPEEEENVDVDPSPTRKRGLPSSLAYASESDDGNLGEDGFTVDEVRACQRLIALAIAEDIGTGDLTSEAVIAEDLLGRAVFVARGAGVLAGLPAAALVVRAIDRTLRFEPLLEDGSRIEPGTRLAALSGPMRGILACERIALNFLQHLSGVASLTRTFVDAVAGLNVKILDTRKTLPGWRLLQKYAVRCGGGHNHRMGLYDGILIKDNHLAAFPLGIVRAIGLAVERARAGEGESRRGGDTEIGRKGEGEKGRRGLGDLSSSLPVPLSPSPPLPPPVEVEVESLEQLDAALSCRPDIILLDNMAPEVMREAVRRRDSTARIVELEASGGIHLQTVRAIAETGVDRISIGALTHSAPALDIALDYERQPSHG